MQNDTLRYRGGLFTTYTYQDYEAAEEKLDFVYKAIEAYQCSPQYIHAKDAELYFEGLNTRVTNSKKEFNSRNGKSYAFRTSYAISNFFFRFVVQQNQYLLSNGMQLNGQESKEKLGFGFDTALERLGEGALKHGVSWGFWNNGHLEQFSALEYFALLDERTGIPALGIRFWRINPDKDMRVIVYEQDGYTEYVVKDNKLELVKTKIGNAEFDKAPYRVTIRKDALEEQIIEKSDYGALPIVPLFANNERRSELTLAIQTKIDLYDIVLSDFGDNLERANFVYWVLRNYGGDKQQILDMIAEIEELKVAVNQDDGLTAEPKTFDVPFQARQCALDILHAELYSDYMAVDINAIQGGSLTNVAINAAFTALDEKTDRYEWQVFDFCQQICALAGIDTEDIKFPRRMIYNKKEMTDALATYRDDIDLQTALEKNPYIEQDEIQDIVDRKAAEETKGTAGLPSLEEMAQMVERFKNGKTAEEEPENEEE